MFRSTFSETKIVDWMAAFWFLGITFLSLIPLPELPDIPGDDKTLHVISYAFLAFLGTLSRKNLAAVAAVAATFVFYGGLIEIIQPYINRYGEFGDFAANTIGVILGTILAMWMARRLKLRSSRRQN